MHARVIPILPRGDGARPGALRLDPLEGLVPAVLAEVARELERLAQDPGHVQIIDLNSLPLDPATTQALRHALGDGEVSMQIRSAAFTQVRETGYAGVWWQTQGRNAADAGAAATQDRLESIVVAAVPPLAAAHPDDIAGALQRLASAAREPLRDGAMQATGDAHE